jgi:hypothetical protein
MLPPHLFFSAEVSKQVNKTLLIGKNFKMNSLVEPFDVEEASIHHTRMLVKSLTSNAFLCDEENVEMLAMLKCS